MSSSPAVRIWIELDEVGCLTSEKYEIARQWVVAIRLAEANGASLRDIAGVAGASPQSIANLLDR